MRDFLERLHDYLRCLGYLALNDFVFRAKLTQADNHATENFLKGIGLLRLVRPGPLLGAGR